MIGVYIARPDDVAGQECRKDDRGGQGRAAEDGPMRRGLPRGVRYQLAELPIRPPCGPADE